MTRTDLKVEYKLLSGNYPPDYNIPDLPSVRETWKAQMEDYIEWLETSLITLHNKATGSEEIDTTTKDGGTYELKLRR